MSTKFEYTTLAHRYTARFPVLTYVGTQTNFWIIANIFLATIFHFQSQIISQTYKIPVAERFGTVLLISVMLGVVYGVTLGLTGYYLDRALFRKQALGKVILLKTLISLGVLLLILSLLRYVFFDPSISTSLLSGFTLNETSWRSLFFLLVIYYFFMNLIISFINQINKKYGPGILLPLLLGRYRHPKEEDRIFMFMDLKSSTTTAEELGHLKYSSFIRDCFADINEVLYPFCAQVYQYVGDEIVLTWPESEGLKDHACLRFYFACKNQFRRRAAYYRTTYGILPDFKAGTHTGTVTTVEIGEYKRDLAYHGDTLNTASRIQSVCNDYGKSFLVSKVLLEKIGSHPDMLTQELGMIQLKGKATKVALVSVDWIEKLSD
jgi:adenylate cyclase